MNLYMSNFYTTAKYFISGVVSLGLLATAQQKGLAQARAGSEVNISVFPTEKAQKIRSIGGNYCQATYTDNAKDTIGILTLKNLKPQYVRVPIPLKFWEPVNDNDNANSLNYAAFKDEGVIHTLLLFLQDMKEKYGVENITASVWDVPDWMVSNPQDRAQRKIKPGLYQETAESVAAFLLKAKDDYGVQIDNFSFNEATGGYQIIFSPQEIIAFIKVAGPYFRSVGLKTKFLTADSHQTKGTVEYATPLLKEPSIRKYLGPLAYHSWWSEEMDNREFERIDSLGKAYHKEIWCTEVGYDAMAWRTPEVFPGWDYAWRYAKIMLRVLKYSGAAVTEYWTYENNYPIIGKDLNPYPVYYVTEELTRNLPQGTFIIKTTSDDDAVWVLGARKGTSHYFLQILNTSDQEKSVKISGIPKITLYGKYMNGTNAREGLSAGEQIPRTDGRYVLNIPPQTVGFITTDNTPSVLKK